MSTSQNYPSDSLLDILDHLKNEGYTVHFWPEQLGFTNGKDGIVTGTFYRRWYDDSNDERVDIYTIINGAHMGVALIKV